MLFKFANGVLIQTNLYYIDSRQCFISYTNPPHTFPTVQKWYELKKKAFCAKGKNDETACRGDSGGAAIWKDPKRNNRATVIGVISGGLDCGGKPPIDPTIFATIPGKVAEWIKAKISDTTC